MCATRAEDAAKPTLKATGVEFIDENDGGPRVRLRRRPQKIASAPGACSPNANADQRSDTGEVSWTDQHEPQCRAHERC